MANLHSYQNTDALERRGQELRTELRSADPAVLAARTGAVYKPVGERGGELRLALLSERYVVRTPELTVLDAETGAAASLHTQALLLYYLRTSDGTPVGGRWISFRELPGGGFYHRAFQGYTGRQIAREFRNDLCAFERAAINLSGRPEDLGDAAFSFRALPRIPVLAAYWLGDEDLPPSARVLFDSSAGHYLPTDALAVLGSMLSRRLIARGAQRGSQLHVTQ